MGDPLPETPEAPLTVLTALHPLSPAAHRACAQGGGLGSELGVGRRCVTSSWRFIRRIHEPM